MDLNPIETRHRGHRFRSRLEACWAVFVDALKIEYVYETEGFNLDALEAEPPSTEALRSFGVGKRPSSLASFVDRDPHYVSRRA